MLLDNLITHWDARRVESIRINAPPCDVYEATLHVDFVEAARQSRAVRTLFALRSAAEQLITILSGHRWYDPTEPLTLRLADLPARGEWVKLGENPHREITFGAVGRFWAGETRWEEIDAAGFASFDHPGYARIGCRLACSELPDGSTKLTYDVRTLATDPASRRAFLRYWWVVSPFVGVIMRSLLKSVAINVSNRVPVHLAQPVA